MRITLTDEASPQRRHVAGTPQMWGMVCLHGPSQNIRQVLTTRWRQPSEVEWAAGDTWCLVWEGKKDHHHSLVSCDQEALHAAVAGNVWPLGEGTENDAPLVAGLYRRHGTDIINHCDGQFAAALVDEKNGRVVLTVSWPGGFHPLYYCTDGQSLGFATRLDLLVNRCGWQAKVNEQAVVDLFRSGGLVGDASLLTGVQRVIPGHAVIFEQGNAAQGPVLRWPSGAERDPSDATEVARLHRAAVQRRISGPDDFGLFLSGGLDSGLNVAVAAELSGRPVKTFSAAFDIAEFDESSYARLVAAKYDTEHHEVRLSTAGCLDRLPEMVWAMQEPIIDYSYIPTFFIAEAIRKHVDVAIGGDGPDHLLGRNYQYAAWYDLLSRVPWASHAAAWLVQANHRAAGVRHGFWQCARRHRLGRQLWQAFACVPEPCGLGMLNDFCNDLWGDLPSGDLLRLLSPDLLRRVDLSADNHKWAETLNLDQVSSSLNRFILADAALGGMCGVFAKAGAMGSAHDLTIQEPYLASPLLWCFLGLQDPWKVQGSWSRRLTRTIPAAETKRILRQVATHYLPEEIVWQKQKHGFEFPLVQCWRESTSRAGARQIFGELLGGTDWFDPAYLERLVREQASGARNHRYLLLLLAALDQWFRIFIRGRAEPPTWRWSNCF